VPKVPRRETGVSSCGRICIKGAIQEARETQDFRVESRQLIEDIFPDREVKFVAKDTKARRLVPTRCRLPEFVRLLASHVPDRYRQAIRYFGLLAPRAKGQTFAALFVLLGETKRPRPQRLSWRSSILKYFGRDPLIDSRGQAMRWVRREKPMTRQ
jgi:hypothetical protein